MLTKFTYVITLITYVFTEITYVFIRYKCNLFIKYVNFFHTIEALAAEDISNSLKCEIKGCEVDQYDVCAIECHKMLCIKHIQLHEQVKSCHPK